MSSSHPSHKAAVLHGAYDMRIESCTTTLPGPDEVQIRIRATGICGSDMHYYESGRNGMFKLQSPLVMGHEGAGEVVAVGENVTQFRNGDRVAIEPQWPCGQCKLCWGGSYNVCPQMKCTGSASRNPPIQGCLQELYNHRASRAFKIPESMSFEEGALLEPLSVALHAVRRSGLRIGHSVLVLGAGPIGLLCASIAKAAGASRVCIVDIEQSRLEFAMGGRGAAKTVATESYHIATPSNNAESDKEDSTQKTVKDILQSTDIGAPDLVFECTGVTSCINVAIGCAAPRSKVILVGIGSPTQSINLGAAAIKEVDLVLVFRYANTFPDAIDLVREGHVDLQSLITHKYDLSQAEKALELVLSKPKDLIKCVVTSEDCPSSNKNS